MVRIVVWVGLGTFAVLAGGFLGVMQWISRMDDPTAAERWERESEPLPPTSGRHRAAP